MACSSARARVPARCVRAAALALVVLAVDGAPALAGGAHTAYVVNSDGSATPIDTQTNTAGAPVPLGSPGSAIAINSDSTTAWVTHNLSDTVTAVDLRTGATIKSISVGHQPSAVAVNPYAN